MGMGKQTFLGAAAGGIAPTDRGVTNDVQSARKAASLGCKSPKDEGFQPLEKLLLILTCGLMYSHLN